MARCQELVTRHNWPARCSREAVFRVGKRKLCTQHARNEAKRYDVVLLEHIHPRPTPRREGEAR